jgi:hypothetical protein
LLAESAIASQCRYILNQGSEACKRSGACEFAHLVECFVGNRFATVRFELELLSVCEETCCLVFDFAAKGG